MMTPNCSLFPAIFFLLRVLVFGGCANPLSSRIPAPLVRLPLSAAKKPPASSIRNEIVARNLLFLRVLTSQLRPNPFYVNPHTISDMSVAHRFTYNICTIDPTCTTSQGCSGTQKKRQLQGTPSQDTHSWESFKQPFSILLLTILNWPTQRAATKPTDH
ncbi:hypothetical protein HDK77DRAFT_314932 [Phyllosticta capitalensis]|uniref:Secreted protein n=1 Tax=Phyllosticta capitalensis TaxID=121624 RepID=A0ABR1YII4_9PEZI